MPTVNVRENAKNFNEVKLRLISLVISSKCNNHCKYCYEKHELRNEKIMDIALAKDVVNYYMNEDGTDFVEIDMFGGEPFLAFEFIRELVEWFHTKSWEKKYRFLIGTNGTILNDEIKEWLIKNRWCLNVGLSIDGTKTAHDLCRSNSYDALYRNLPFFLKYWSHQPAKMTICADTIPYAADGVIELEEMGLIFTANITFEDQWGDDENKERLLKLYEKQLSRLVDYYTGHPNLYPVSPLLTSVPEYLGIPNFEEMNKKVIKRYCGAGHEMVVIDIDGRKYPCHRFIPWISNKPAPPEKMNCQNAWKPDKCARCKLLTSCPTCAGFNWEINGDTGLRTTFHCEAFKREVMASCLIEWKRLSEKMKNKNTLGIKEKNLIKRRTEALMEIIKSDI